MTKPLLGQILIELKVATEAQIKEALRLQMVSPAKLLGQLLIEMEVATYAQVAEALTRQEKL